MKRIDVDVETELSFKNRLQILFSPKVTKIHFSNCKFKIDGKELKGGRDE